MAKPEMSRPIAPRKGAKISRMGPGIGISMNGKCRWAKPTSAMPGISRSTEKATQRAPSTLTCLATREGRANPGLGLVCAGRLVGRIED